MYVYFLATAVYSLAAKFGAMARKSELTLDGKENNNSQFHYII